MVRSVNRKNGCIFIILYFMVGVVHADAMRRAGEVSGKLHDNLVGKKPAPAVILAPKSMRIDKLCTVFAAEINGNNNMLEQNITGSVEINC